MQKKLVLVCLINFLIAGLMGLTLRYFYVNPVAINYRYLTHAHSHVAMLGWVYLMLYLFIVHHFVPKKKPVYNILFWITEFSVIGMMLSFPFQGYAAISITFSALHVFSSYYFVRLIWKNHKVSSVPVKYFLKAALVFMAVSTLGVLCLGPASATLGPSSAFYNIAIQFFLHFQFNGWFLFGVLALFLRYFPIQNMVLFKRFFWVLIGATILTFALIVSWFAFHPILLWINGLGVVLQLLAGIYFIKLLQPHWKEFWMPLPALTKWMFRLALISFAIKVVFQTLSILPVVAKMAFQFHNFVIGFIHLMMLGVISGFLFAFLLKTYRSFKNYKSVKIGVFSFLIGFLTTELLLILQGLFFYLGLGLIPNYYLILFICSIFLPLGIFIFILNLIQHDSKTIKTT